MRAEERGSDQDEDRRLPRRRRLSMRRRSLRRTSADGGIEEKGSGLGRSYALLPSSAACPYVARFAQIPMEEIVTVN